MCVCVCVHICKFRTKTFGIIEKISIASLTSIYLTSQVVLSFKVLIGFPDKDGSKSLITLPHVQYFKLLFSAYGLSKVFELLQIYTISVCIFI